MANSVKKCQVDSLRNSFVDLYSKYSFLCSVDDNLYSFIDSSDSENLELFIITFLFFLKSINSDFDKIYQEFHEILND